MFLIQLLLCGIFVKTSMASWNANGRLIPDLVTGNYAADQMCRRFYELSLQKRDEAEFIESLDSLYKHFKDKWKLFPEGLTKQNEVLEYLKEKRCVNSKLSYEYPECFYLLIWEIKNDNPDWKSLFNHGQHSGITKSTYIFLWRQHPLMRDCKRQMTATVYPPLSFVKEIKNQNDNEARIVSKTEHYTTKLRKEVDKYCTTYEAPPGDFCPDMLDIARLVDAYYAVKNVKSDEKKWNAYQLHFIFLKHNIPGTYSSIDPSDTATDELILKNLNQIFAYITNGQISELTEMMALVPTRFSSSGCENFFALSTTKKNVCMIGKVVLSVQAYLKSLISNPNGEVIKILNTNIDYPSFLRMTEISSISSVVQNQARASTELASWVNTEVKKNVANRFLGLQQYFQKVESFNRDKSKADVDFIKGRLDEYRTEVTALTTDLSQRLSELMKHAFTSVGLEIAENVVQLALAFASACNPLNQLLGGGAFGDVMDKAATLANTLTDVALLTRVSKSFDEVLKRVVDISSRFTKNEDFLLNLNTLIKGIEENSISPKFDTQRQQFINEYTAYNPEVKKPELTAMATVYTNLIDACCDVILNTNTLAATAVKGYVKEQGLCPKANEVAEKMIETYAEIYDYQFDLIETMASYMRATTSQHAATDINAYYPELSSPTTPSQEVIDQLKTLTSIAYITYKINMWQITEAYCDILTYEEGGKPPRVCQGREKDIARLVSHVSPTCRNIEGYKDVPVSSTNDQGFMNISDLYAGRRIAFQIPNSEWLVANNWISDQDKDSTIVVKKFEVFLPTQSTIERYIRVRAKMIGENKNSPSSKTTYPIAPNKELIFDFNEGGDSEKTCRQTITNPYGNSLPKLCQLNVDENNCQELLEKTPIFPSVYSRWEITVFGYESSSVQIPANSDFMLRVGVRLCILDQRRNDKAVQKKKKKNVKKTLSKKDAKQKDQERQSCPHGRYWSKKSAQCVPCPKGSRSALDGYFCVKTSKMKI